MKNKNILKYLIKEEVTKFLKEQDEPVRITFETNPLEYILIKYPSLKNTITNLMTTGLKIILPEYILWLLSLLLLK